MSLYDLTVPQKVVYPHTAAKSVSYHLRKKIRNVSSWRLDDCWFSTKQDGIPHSSSSSFKVCWAWGGTTEKAEWRKQNMASDVVKNEIERSRRRQREGREVTANVPGESGVRGQGRIE